MSSKGPCRAHSILKKSALSHTLHQYRLLCTYKAITASSSDANVLVPAETHGLSGEQIALEPREGQSEKVLSAVMEGNYGESRRSI